MAGILISFEHTMNDGTVAAAILAGGRARRLGGAVKSMLALPGWCAGPSDHAAPAPRRADTCRADQETRIIDWQLAALSVVAQHIFIIAPDRRPFESLELDVVADLRPGLGALGGIYTAISTSPCERTLIVAGDMPFLPPALLHRLVRPSAADVVVPHGRRGYEPLCAVYSRRCAASIGRALDAGQLRASRMPDDVHVEEVAAERLAEYDPHGVLFVNVNTPEEYAQARALAASLPAPARRAYHTVTQSAHDSTASSSR